MLERVLRGAVTYSTDDTFKPDLVLPPIEENNGSTLLRAYSKDTS